MPRVPTSPVSGQPIGGGPTVFQNVRGATAESFGAIEGRDLQVAGQQLGAAAESLLQGEVRVQNRRDSLDRLKRKDALSEQLFDLATKTSTEQDITDPNILRGAGQEFKGVANQALQEHIATGASEDSVARFAEQALGEVARYRDDLARKSVQAVAALVKTAEDRVLSEATALVEGNPSRALEVMADLSYQADLNGMHGVGQAAAFAARYQNEVARTAINEFMGQGKVTEAMALMENPKVRAVISPAQRRAITTRQSKITKAPRQLSPLEISEELNMTLEQAAGYAVQEDDTGLEILLRPTAKGRNREEAVQAYIAMGIDEKRANDLAAGDIQIIISNKDGRVYETNKRAGTVTLKTPLADGVARPKLSAKAALRQSQGIYQRVKNTPTSGLLPGMMEAWINTIGQIPGTIPEFAEESLKVRSGILTATNSLVQAFAINKRYPVGLIKLIKEELSIEPSIWRSDKALLIRMEEQAAFLRKKVIDERKIAADPTAPSGRVAAAKSAIFDIEAYLDLLQVPEGADSSQAEEAIPQIGTREQRDALPPGSPYIDATGQRRRTRAK